jgi:molybdopterin molybdotransferase
MADPLPIDGALRAILDRARPLEAELVPIASAAGRVLAQDALAAIDLPRFASSAMDGFALRAADAPATLPVVARIAAGRPAGRALAPGEAMAISTGAVVPDGADSVVPIENVVHDGDSVTIPSAVARGANIRPQGGDVRAGEVVVHAGRPLGPAQIGALAAAGCAHLACALRPRVAVLTTGSELREPGAPLAPGEIYESNGLLIEAVLRAAGAQVERLAPIEDTLEAHREAIARGLEADVLVTSGGVSVGPHDLVRGVAAELGVEEVFWRVAMRPGKPLSFGVRGATLVFGLPGNPVSSLVGMELFVRPAVLALQGLADPRPRFLPGTLASALPRSPQRDDLVRARVEETGGGPLLHPLAGQESHMIVSAAMADALVHVPLGDGELAVGSRVRYLPL